MTNSCEDPRDKTVKKWYKNLKINYSLSYTKSSCLNEASLKIVYNDIIL
jgi:hypothetical protein